MIRPWNRLAALFQYNPTIKRNLFVIYFSLIVIPLSLFTVISHSRVSAVVKNQTLKSATQSLKECITTFDSYINSMSIIMNNFLDTPDLYKLARQAPDFFIPEYQKYYTNIKEIMRYFQNTTEISDISIFTQYSFYSNNAVDPNYSIEKLYQNHWYTELGSGSSRRLWVPVYAADQDAAEGSIAFSYTGRMLDPDNLSKELAVVKIDISTDTVSSLLNSTTATPNSLTCIATGNGILISSNVRENNLPVPEILNTAIPENKLNQWVEETIRNKHYFYYIHRNVNTGWYIISLIPNEDITSLGDRLRQEMLLVMVAIAVISYVMAYLISRSSIRRLSMLTHHMKLVGRGNFSIPAIKSKQDEIGQLIVGFNKMVGDMSRLIEEKYQMGLEVKNLELKALQAQINPHFLYNSLELINCIAIKNNVKEINKMVNALSKFYKLSLSSGHDVIPVADEIAHVTFYVSIQNLRFEDKINLVKDIDEELYQYKTLKIILQPIVENAILHGIFEKPSKTGTIRIRGKLEGNTIVLIVQDDGVGMSEEKLRQILLHDQSDMKHGYGAFNTHNRIALYYGEGYGLHYHSVPGEGTIVTIRLAARK